MINQYFSRYSFSLSVKDLLTLILTIELLLQFKNTYWIVNGLSVEDGISLSPSLSLSLSLSHTHTHTHTTFRVESHLV